MFVSMLKPVFIFPWLLSCFGSGHFTGGAQKFDIYVVAEEDAKDDIFQELREKYDEVEEQSFFLPNKALIVAGSKKTSGPNSKNYESLDEEIIEDVQTFSKRANVFLSNKVELLERHVRSKFRTNDTQWSNMWQINGDVSPSMKVVEAWQSGYNGSGIIVSVVDQGIELDHSDLDANIRLDGHYDFVDSDLNPYPPFNFRHGTQVAGFIAAERDNDNCIAGVAYGSTLIGIRLLGSSYTTDITESRAIAHGYNVTDISSNSWGPPDFYGYFAPGPLTAAAFEFGVTQGREGKGIIYVWAAGNGGTTDNCNADGYANSIYTVTISSVNNKGQPAWYSEICPPALAVTYSGDTNQRYMFTTSNSDSCSDNREGTSFSAPQAAGMVALALQANPNLTWRDVQHLIVKTAKYQNIKEAEGYNFTLNGAGNYVGQMFGYGLMDADAMVRYAKTWKTVPQQKVYNSTISTPYWVLDSGLSEKSESMLVDGTCPIKYLEHVKVLTTFQSSERAYVEFELVSPAGTISKIMTKRQYDRGVSRQQQWVFMSVQFWGEDPEGNWTFSIRIPSTETGNLTSWQLTLYGTSDDPLSEIPPCDEAPCENGGSCTSSSKYDNTSCKCAPGYTGKKCETDINECENLPCLDNATCVDLVNAYNCTCPAGYVYNYTSDPNKCQDINECDNSPCEGNSTCENRPGNYVCLCSSGFIYNETAGDCTEINECESFPCLDNATCVDLVNTYNCTCPAGYVYNYTSDPNKCQDINECDSSPCEGNSTCENRPGYYACICSSGFIYNETAKDCTDINECDSGSCKGNSTCENLPGYYTCLCSNGFIYNETARDCTEINECDSVPCPDGATCLDLVDAYNCTCPAGYVYNYTNNSNTCHDINECDHSPCEGNSTCENSLGSYECLCSTGFIYNETAGDCTDLDECKLSRCSAGHECFNTIGSYICNCTNEKGCADVGSGLSAEIITVIVLSSLTVLTVSGVLVAWLVRHYAFIGKSAKITPLQTDKANRPQHVLDTDGTLKENTAAYIGLPPMNHAIAKGE